MKNGGYYADGVSLKYVSDDPVDNKSAIVGARASCPRPQDIV